MNILLTGATGFIGHHLLRHLLDHTQNAIITSVRCNAKLPNAVRTVDIGDILPDTDWSQALPNVDTVIHLAALVLVANNAATDPLAAFRQINTAGTLNFARQAAAAGVRRFIFLSSIKVNGEYTQPGKPFTTDDTHIPTDPYALSKYEAEQGLRELALQTGMEVVIIRSPLVYGPNVKANFHSMMSWLHKGIPLPLGAIHNKRSLVAIDNLVDLLTACIDHPAASNQTFLVADGEDLSTTELLRRLSVVLGKPARLLPVPQSLLSAMLRLLGKGDIAQRLCSSLQVDIDKTKQRLGWTPPVQVDEALKRTAQAWLAQCG